MTNQYNTTTKNKKGFTSWPNVLISETNQTYYSVACLIASLIGLGLVGLIASIYYLFILDDSVARPQLPRVLCWVTLAMNIIGVILFILWMLFASAAVYAL